MGLTYLSLRYPNDDFLAGVEYSEHEPDNRLNSEKPTSTEAALVMGLIYIALGV